MKYKTISIRPKAFEDGWHITIYADGIERVKRYQPPSALGFYHCFETVSDKDAKRDLLDCMMQDHQKQIEALTKSMSSLTEIWERL